MSEPGVAQKRLYDRIAFHRQQVSMSVRREERQNAGADEHRHQELNELGETIAAVGLSIVQALEGGVK
jgi:hypothetical protein